MEPPFVNDAEMDFWTQFVQDTCFIATDDGTPIRYCFPFFDSFEYRREVAQLYALLQTRRDIFLKINFIQLNLCVSKYSTAYELPALHRDLAAADERLKEEQRRFRHYWSDFEVESMLRNASPVWRKWIWSAPEEDTYVQKRPGIRPILPEEAYWDYMHQKEMSALECEEANE